MIAKRTSALSSRNISTGYPLKHLSKLFHQWLCSFPKFGKLPSKQAINWVKMLYCTVEERSKTFNFISS